MWKSPWLKRAVLAVSLLPLAVLAYKWYNHQLGFNSIEFVARYLGRWTLILLLTTLAITPLRKIRALSPLILFRRMLGLVTFLYATLHGLHYYVRDIQWNPQIIVDDLTHRRFFILGMLAWLLMLPLAATSFDAAIRWMGGKRWRNLHKLVYVSAIAAITHFLLQGKGIDLRPLEYAAVLAVLLLSRVVFAVLPKPQRQAVGATR
jgi:sulfoxide reductase heme-binding subunit YedZ